MDTSRRLFCFALASGLLLSRVVVSRAASARGSDILLEVSKALDEEVQSGVLGRIAIEAGENAVDDLAKCLRTTSDEEEQGRIVIALSYIGGSKSADALFAFFQSTGRAKGRVCFVFASAPNSDRIHFLIDSLKGPHYGDDWYPIVQSAWSLGIIKDRSALSELKKCADLNQGVASVAAADAIKWITLPPPHIQIDTASGDDPLLLAILRSGISGLDGFDRLHEQNSDRLWIKTKMGYLIRQRELTESVDQKLNINVYRSEDNMRALVRLDLHLGNLNGAGYEYVLHKQADKWIVRGLSQTWMS